MGIPREEVEKLLAPVEHLIEDGIEKKDSTQIASAYSEDAAVVHLGHSVVRTRAAVAAAYDEVFKGDTSKMRREKIAGYDVNDGEYLMRKGRYCLADGITWYDYMVLYEKQPDGSYLVILDQY